MCGGQAVYRGRGLVILAVITVAQAMSASSASAADDGLGLLDSVLQTLNVKTAVGPTPDFVKATHPDPSTLHFIPTGAPHPKRAEKVKSIADIEAAKVSLDAARDAQVNPPPKVVSRPLKAHRTVKQN